MIRSFAVLNKRVPNLVSNLTSRTIFRRFVTTIMSNIKIGTHDGVFHCDEALACFMLKLLPRYKDATIIRSRDQKILDTCDIVVDVGGQYDPSKHRYDHHMREFNESVSTVIKKPGYDWTIKLSSAGLIYCHFGLEIVKQIINKDDIDDASVECIYKKVYDTLIKEIDAVDNGVPICEGEQRYHITTGISSRVERLNSKWNSPPMDVEEQFRKAMSLVGEELIESVQYFTNVWLPARKIVEAAVAKRFEVDESGEIIILSQTVPWIQHLFDIEKDNGIEPSIKYAIFGADNGYRVRAVPVAPDSFVCRIFLPEAWGGLRDDELVKTSGIEKCIFVHSIRFIGGALTLDAALAMARKALEMGKTQ